MPSELTFKELQESHPTWARSNLDFARRGYSKGYDEFSKRMTLLTLPCTKCGEEMGEHEWGSQQFTCPVNPGSIEVLGLERK